MASVTWRSTTGWTACARRSLPHLLRPSRDHHRAGRARPARWSCRSLRRRGGARRLRRRDRRPVALPAGDLAGRRGREGRHGTDRSTWRSTSGRRFRSPGCCSSLGYADHGAPGSRTPCRVADAATWCPRSPRRCGGRPSGRFTRACCPATSSWRRARPCCAAGCAKARSSRPPRAAAPAGDQARRVHRRHPGEPDPADGVRADALRAASGCRVRSGCCGGCCGSSAT